MWSDSGCGHVSSLEADLKASSVVRNPLRLMNCIPKVPNSQYFLSIYVIQNLFASPSPV